MELVRWDQVEGVNRIQSRINELFEDTFGRTRAQPSANAGAWYPPVDILESKDSYLVRAELPGAQPKGSKRCRLYQLHIVLLQRAADDWHPVQRLSNSNQRPSNGAKFSMSYFPTLTR